MTIKSEIQGDNAADVLGQMQTVLRGSGGVPQDVQIESAMAQIDVDAMGVGAPSDVGGRERSPKVSGWFP